MDHVVFRNMGIYIFGAKKNGFPKRRLFSKVPKVLTLVARLFGSLKICLREALLRKYTVLSVSHAATLLWTTKQAQRNLRMTSCNCT